ncbi:hypothetical protein Y1Q_0008070 [Alligator mississippiensis]|uniref:Reverse transcriptase zinc-binding domain-containing protein n=1 Tax=Alligator mississippiensis TaxID=8496 RepID=A0A151NFS9_ALLMI|nr:hypothetical protein Y1Q_0008070 [Alligator mississippiensis]
MISKLATDTEAKTTCLVRYFLRHWGVFTLSSHRPWITVVLQDPEPVPQCVQPAEHGSGKHEKPQEDPGDGETKGHHIARGPTPTCQAVWEHIHHKELHKDHKDLNWLIAHQALPVRAQRHREGQLGRPSCPWPNCYEATETIGYLFRLCTCTKEVWKRVKQLCEAVTFVSWLTSKAAVYGHLTKHQGSLSPHFDLFASCVRSTLWKARNLLLYRQMDIEVVGCVKIALRELQTYYQKSVAEDGEDTSKVTWHKDMWHRIIQPPPSPHPK